MYAGYLSLYMLSQGVTKGQLGLITSIGLIANMVIALLSPYITDKFGRRNATLIFGIIGWNLPMIFWILANDITLFIVGTIVNAFAYVPMNSCQCLLIEDSSPEERIHIFNFMQVATIFAGFFAPLGGILISKFTFVPAMRIILVITVIMMFTQFVVRHLFVKETKIGKIKMEQMKNVKIGSVFKDYLLALKRISKDSFLVIAIILRTINFIQLTMKNTFLVVLITERLGFGAETMALFNTLAAIVMLIVLILITPLLARVTKRWPIALGLICHICSTLILLLSPSNQNYFLLITCAVFDALGIAITTPRVDALFANSTKNEDRSVTYSVMYVLLLIVSTPFGYIGGLLSEIDTRLPFLLTFVLLLCALLILLFSMKKEKTISATITIE